MTDEIGFSEGFIPPAWPESVGYVSKLTDLTNYLTGIALEGDPHYDPFKAGKTFDLDASNECYFLILSIIAFVYQTEVLGGLGYDSNGNRHELWIRGGDLFEGLAKFPDPVAVTNYFCLLGNRKPKKNKKEKNKDEPNITEADAFTERI